MRPTAPSHPRSLSTTIIKRPRPREHPMRILAASVPLILLLSGCAGSPTDPEVPAVGGSDELGNFSIPWMRVGDALTYDFTFTQGDSGRSFTGSTSFSVVGLETITDGYGTQRPAIRLRQSNPDGSFAENYLVDAK